MIKGLPGWANYLFLWLGYLALTIFLHWMYNDFIWSWENVRFDMIITAVYCGGYLAKWRFYQKPDGSWEKRFF